MENINNLFLGKVGRTRMSAKTGNVCHSYNAGKTVG